MFMHRILVHQRKTGDIAPRSAAEPRIPWIYDSVSTGAHRVRALEFVRNMLAPVEHDDNIEGRCWPSPATPSPDSACMHLGTYGAARARRLNPISPNSECAIFVCGEVIA